MRVVAFCVAFLCAAFSVSSVRADSGPGASQSVSGLEAGQCSQCSSLAEKHEELVQRINLLRGKRRSALARAKGLATKREARQDELLKLGARYSSVQEDALKLGAAKNAGSDGASVKKFAATRLKIEVSERRLRADVATLNKAVPQAEAAADAADAELEKAITQRLAIRLAMANCEQRCVVADGPGTVLLTASSLTDIAQSNQSAIRDAARGSTQCRSCNALQVQIDTTTREINAKKQVETRLRQRMKDLDGQRAEIRNEWRDLYNQYSEKLLARLKEERNDGEPNALDQDLNRISEQIIDANVRRQRLLTREGQLQDQLMQTGRERDRLAKKRRNLRAGLGACEELCVTGVANAAVEGMQLAARPVNLAPLSATCSRCRSLAGLVNDVTATLRTRITERDTLEAGFARIAPALEQIQARRRSIIEYAGELADLMEEFRRSGDVARAKRELSQISAQSQRLSTDIIRILDQREKLEQRIDTNADAITRLSILSRQRRREQAACEQRCRTTDATVADIAIKRPNLSFRTPRPTRTRCNRCQLIGKIIDQQQLLLQSEQASLTVATAELQVKQSRLAQINQALQLNARSIRNAQRNSQSKQLLDGLRAEAKFVRGEKSRLDDLIKDVTSNRETISNRISAITLQIRQRQTALQRCESSCQVVRDTPQATLANASRIVARADQATQKICADCRDKVENVKDFAADIRADQRQMQVQDRQAARQIRDVRSFDRQIANNRTTVLRGVRAWFDTKDAKARTARTRSVIDQAWKTARLSDTVARTANNYVSASTNRDRAQAGLVQTLPSLEKALRELERCGETCSANQPENIETANNTFAEKNPDALIVKPQRVRDVRAGCDQCADRATTLTQVIRLRADAVARAATARNVIASAERILRQIRDADSKVRARVTKLVKERFLSDNTSTKAALKRRLDQLQAETLRMDRARTSQTARINTATGDADEARQDLRKADRDLAAARAEMRQCENTCKIAEGDTDKSTSTDETKTADNGQTDTDNGDNNADDKQSGTGKTIARLPGQDTTDEKTRATEEASGVTSPTADPVVKTACQRCAVFAKRINELSTARTTRRAKRDAAVRARQDIIKTIRSGTGGTISRAKLILERGKLTRMIERSNTALDRLENRIRKLRISLERCEKSCSAEPAIASNATEEDTPATDEQASDPDTREVASDNSQPENSGTDDTPPAVRTTKAPKQQRRRKSQPKVVIADTALPRRKELPEVIVEPTVFDRMVSVITRNDTVATGWETSVDVAAGAGNVWASETASISVQPADGSKRIKLDATSFAITVRGRSLDPIGDGVVAWGSLKVTRADGNAATTVLANGTETAVTRTADYTKLRATAGVGHEIVDCLDGGGHCAIGVMAGIEHASLEENHTGAMLTNTSSIDSNAIVFGVWGDMRVPLAQMETSGVALVLRGDAFAKAGQASGKFASTTTAGSTSGKASSAYIGFGADLAAELELAFDGGAIAVGANVGVDTLPVISVDGGSVDVESKTSTSSTVYVRGTLKF